MTTAYSTYWNLKKTVVLDETALNERFCRLHYEERLRLLYRYFSPDEVLFTSSFGTKSVFLLHLISQIQPGQTIHFIDTGFHFPETLAYKEQLTRAFGLEVVDVRPEPGQHEASRLEQLWAGDPGLCCTVNKVLPLEPLKARHRVWISGLMANQTEYRSGLKVFEKKGEMLKFHPLIDIDEGEFLYHLSFYGLPQHPLESQGFGSIGCSHCTVAGKGREGRWKGTNKKECGLHLE